MKKVRRCSVCAGSAEGVLWGGCNYGVQIETCHFNRKVRGPEPFMFWNPLTLICSASQRKLLREFEFSPPCYPITGKEQSLNPDAYNLDILQASLPFKVQIKPRSEKHGATIEQEPEEASVLVKKGKGYRPIYPISVPYFGAMNIVMPNCS